MSILVIGKSAFLAQSLKALDIAKVSHFIGHQTALNTQQWPKGTHCVINFACAPTVREGIFSNLDHQFAQKAADIGAHYVMLSSRAVYGTGSELRKFTEDQQLPVKKITPYGQVKQQIEQDLLESFDNLTILRLSNIFGFEYEANKTRRTFMGTLLKSLKEEGHIHLKISPDTKRDSLPVDIFAHWLSLILQNPKSGIFNIGAGFGTRLGDIAQWVIEGYGKGDILTPRNETYDNYVLDMNKTRAAFSLPPIEKKLIKQRCIEIGKNLKISYK